MLRPQAKTLLSVVNFDQLFGDVLLICWLKYAFTFDDGGTGDPEEY